ncbi:MAG: hypothetical protein ACRCW9_10175 [Cetobacterium sp.]
MKNNSDQEVATMLIPICIITSYPFSFTATGYYAVGDINTVAHKVTFNSPTSLSRRSHYDTLEIWAI